MGIVSAASTQPIYEPTTGNQDYTITVTRDGDLTVGASFQAYIFGAGYNSLGGTGGTATANAQDFVTYSQSYGYDFDYQYYPINFAVGQSSVNVTFTVKSDTLAEGDETVRFAVYDYNPNVGYGYNTVSVLTIHDATPGVLSAGNVSVVERDTLSQTGYFTITRAGGTAAASVSYSILDGDGFNAPKATSGDDYAASRTGTVSFAAGQTTATVPFQVFGDTIPEQNETFRLVLSNPTNGATLGRATGIATIIDNDAPAGSQFGTEGNDTLISNTPGAFLVGMGGNDTYLVNNAADVVIEQNGGGTDIVYTTVSYNLGANEVEAMSVANQMTTDAINLTGNYASQTIVGNYGDNVLNGGSGVDTLIGLYGNDTYVLGDSRIVIQEQAGQGFDTVLTSASYTLAAGVSVEQLVAQDRSTTTGLALVGNEFDQTIGGTNGADTIDGGLGADILVGFDGADTFAFTTALGGGNVDTIIDFQSGTDKIALSSSVFGAIGTGLDANEFVVGSAATTADQHIVYNQATGQLFYDADGSGAGAAVLFAQVSPGAAVSLADFVVTTPMAAAA